MNREVSEHLCKLVYTSSHPTSDTHLCMVVFDKTRAITHRHRGYVNLVLGEEKILYNVREPSVEIKALIPSSITELTHRTELKIGEYFGNRQYSFFSQDSSQANIDLNSVACHYAKVGIRLIDIILAQMDNFLPMPPEMEHIPPAKRHASEFK